MNLIMVLGYLGSGKTTFITNALRQLSGQKNAVIVNDFAKKDVDGVILDNKGFQIKKIFDGSIFCACKSDMFAESMLDLIKTKPDNIIVEASGLANPYTMLRELNLIQDKGKTQFKTNVFCLVDTGNFEKILSVLHAVKIQIASSDVVVLNKIDLTDDVTTFRVQKLIEENTNAEIVKTQNAILDKYFDYPIVKKTMPQLIEDLTLQKLVLTVDNCTRQDIDDVCAKLSLVSSRIKGVLTIDGQNYIYEYVDGKSKVKETKTKDGFLAVLSCFKRSLKNDVKEIIKPYDFIKLND